MLEMGMKMKTIQLQFLNYPIYRFGILVSRYLGMDFTSFKILLKALDCHGDTRNVSSAIVGAQIWNSIHLILNPFHADCLPMTETVQVCVLSLREMSLDVLAVLVCFGCHNKILNTG